MGVGVDARSVQSCKAFQGVSPATRRRGLGHDSSRKLDEQAQQRPLPASHHHKADELMGATTGWLGREQGLGEGGMHRLSPPSWGRGPDGQGRPM